MRILVIPGTFDGANLGDTAMFQIALERMKTLWPNAVFLVLMHGSTLCSPAGMEVIPVSVDGCRFWVGQKRRTLKALLPHRRYKARKFARALSGSDRVVLAGAGILTDAFEATSLRILAVLGAAADRGIPTAILGQGLGPIEGESFLDAAAKVLPRLDTVFIREGDASLSLLRKLNVPEERISVTGDDAVELSWRQRTEVPGKCLGVSLRIASYGGVQAEMTETVRGVIIRKSTELGAPLLGLPVSRGPKDSDLRTLNALLPERGNADSMPWTVPALIERVSRCRVVVAASYHAAVFALSQGIPVVGIVQSEYYARKFHGLANQFGGGCVVISAGDGKFADRLAKAVDNAWNSSAEQKPVLLAAAERQIAAGKQAYQKLLDVRSNHLSP